MTLNLAREVLEPMHQKKASLCSSQKRGGAVGVCLQTLPGGTRYEFTQQEELSHPDTSVVCSVRENEVGISKQ